MTHPTDSASTPALEFKTVARVWIVTLAASLAAGLIAWAAAESMLIDETGRGSKGGRTPIAPMVYSTRNAISSLGLLGGSLGLALGLAGGSLRGSARSASLAGLLGGVLGGAAGAVAARILVPVYFSNFSGMSLSVPLLVHGGLWASISVAAGLAFGLGIAGPGGVIETVSYAIVGALLATFSYEFAGVWLFPTAQTDRPLALSSGSRLFAALAVSLIVGAALALGASRSRSSKSAPAPIVS